MNKDHQITIRPYNYYCKKSTIEVKSKKKIMKITNDTAAFNFSLEPNFTNSLKLMI